MLAYPLLMLALAVPAATPLSNIDLYRMRQQISDAHKAWLELKVEIAVHQISEDAWPADAAAAGIAASLLSAPELGVSNMRVQNGAILVTFGGKIHPALEGRVLGITPCENPGSYAMWSCGMASCPSGHPAPAGAPISREVTTIPLEALPASCR